MSTDIRHGAELGEAGRYRLERLLGAGGMASVWLAHDAVRDRPVAVKVLSDVLTYDSEFVARFEREGRVAAGLAHPGLVEVFESGAQSGRPYLVMEHIPGGTLAHRLRNPAEGVPDPERLAAELLEALAYVHGAGIVHRDIKPANILLGADGRARLTDFGIAQPTDATRITCTGTVLGTRRYAAPEILAGLPATERSDLYALGVVLGECAGGRGTPRLYGLVDALTRLDPEQRPASAMAAMALLAAAPPDAPTTWLPPRPPGDGPVTRVLPTVGFPARERVADVLAEHAERRTHARLLRPRAGGLVPPVVGGAALALCALLFASNASADAPPAPPAQVVTANKAAANKAPSNKAAAKKAPAKKADLLQRQLDRLAAAIDRAHK